VSAGLTTITRATCGSMIRAISHAPPVTSNATRSSGPRLPANNSNAAGVVSIRPFGADLAVLCDRDLTEVTMHIQPDRPHPTTPHVARLQFGEPVGNDADGIALAAQPDQSHGRPLKSSGSNAHRAKPACPSCVPKKPLFQ
jgi:hypothetical protein